MMHDEEVIDDLLDKIEALKAERDAANRRAEIAESDAAKIGWKIYPFVHLRWDLSPAETESALRSKLIEMGWTPPAGEVQP